MNKLIQCDLDNVLHVMEKYDGKVNGKPVEGAVKAMHKLVDTGFEVEVFTARDTSEFEKIYKWLDKWGFPLMDITNVKRPALCYIDDRGLRFTNWNDMLRYFV